MIKTMSVAVCDICGFIAQAKVIGSQYNDAIYGAPDGWGKGAANNVLICPSCVKKLQITYRSDQSTAAPCKHERSTAHV